MDNSQFRKLVLDTPARQARVSEEKTPLGAPLRRDGATPALGSRMRSSIPMTPRSLGGVGSIDFARQLAERAASANKPQKKFRSSAAPKGSKLPAGYVDRTQMRTSEDEDDKANRVKALEEMMKLQQIDEPTFIKLRDQITGGDISSTHLVKGLDFKLLERVRKGEDVLSEKQEEPAMGDETVQHLDDEFEKLEGKEIVAATKETTTKKGEMAPPASMPGKKRTRDQILAELKASRQAAREAAQPALGSKFKKVGAPRSTSRIEMDRKGREVLITFDEDGNEKRKVRKLQPQAKKGNELLMPDKNVKPLGMEVPETPKDPEVDEKDVDIFDDAGDDYNPLAELEEEDDGEETLHTGHDRLRIFSKELSEDHVQTEKPAQPEESEIDTLRKPPGPRNYFGETKTEPTKEDKAPDLFSDPNYLAALRKAANLNPVSQSAESKEEAAKAARRRQMLQQDDRDAMDMDMGFGSSKLADEEDFEEDKVKLSEWGMDDNGGTSKGEGKGKRKRGPKKRKGDSNSAADIMRVLERRKAT